MKKVFVANKHSYGSEFYGVCDTLDDLKRGIVAHELYFEDNTYTNDKYTEELFKKCCMQGGYALYEVDLHPEEEITFDGYDGQSWFIIRKIEPNILSIRREIKGE